MPEGRQSPPPEAQSGKQQQDAPGSGKGVQDVNSGDKKDQQADQLKNLESNPKGAYGDALDKKFEKTQK
ncbi:hypothetical protein BKA67DRAFT_662547 [Truncatella angustata]|uniref:Uncharacterized protein n=1 Tax=Truncatella angustata TaxID=152316 RepID=A0A9P8RQU1_9PEZI|nr:uncharacterized protein BKA67DRAFT_662547 [Truncatella angustata]KAH6647787.1 hypothetical protein BKA67DRAFT_662547 [Truncatella angustata]KAH8204420.1 hypothetical protein TruAng_001336 [Truncatella angustata]